MTAWSKKYQTLSKMYCSVTGLYKQVVKTHSSRSYHFYFHRLINLPHVPLVSHGPCWSWVCSPELCSISQIDDWHGSHDTFLHVLKDGRKRWYKPQFLSNTIFILITKGWNYVQFVLNTPVLPSFGFRDTILLTSPASFVIQCVQKFLLYVYSQSLEQASRLLALSTIHMTMTLRFLFPVQVTRSYIQLPTWYCHLGGIEYTSSTPDLPTHINLMLPVTSSEDVPFILQLLRPQLAYLHNRTPSGPSLLPPSAKVALRFTWIIAMAFFQMPCTTLSSCTGFLWLLNTFPQTWCLKQQTFIISQLWKPEVPSQGVSWAMLPPGALGENPSFPCLASDGCKHPLACACSTLTSAFVCTWPFPLCLCFLFFLLQDIWLWVGIGPTHII